MKNLLLIYGGILLWIILYCICQEINKINNEEPESSIRHRRSIGQ